MDEDKFKPVLHIRKSTFQRRIEYLWEKGYKIVSLEKGMALIQSEKAEKNVIVTFDDGWFSNLAHAHPIMAKYGVPYTIYIASYYSSNSFPVTNIIIPYIFWKTALSESEVINRLPDEYRGNVRKINNILPILIQECNTLRTKEERIFFIQELSELLDVDIAKILENRSFEYLSRSEIKKMSEEGVDFHLHTHSHAFPPDKEIARNEINENQEYLCELLGEKSHHFCYPSGRIPRENFSVLAQTGIKTAVTCLPGLNDKDTHKYLLKRFLDSEDVSEIVFQAEISGFLSILRSFI